MQKFQLDDLEVNIAPTGVSDSVGLLACEIVMIIFIMP